MIKNCTLLLMMGCLPMLILAQNTGKFDTQINFNGEQRDISGFAPNDYDDSQEYKLLIGLHGLNDNSSNYRNAIIDQLNWDEHFSNTILIFPDGGDDDLSDFYSPEGDEAVIDSTIAYAKNHYNIDNDKIILQGFSLGGRSALKYGLESPEKFWGLLLNTPALQGLLDAKNDSMASLVYPYENASEIPIFISNGSEDQIYVNPIDTAYHRMIKHDGLVEKNTVEGMEHRVAPFEELEAALPFFEDHYITPGKNLEILSVYSPSRTCASTTEPLALVRNRGNGSIENFELEISIGQSVEKHQWTGNLEPYESEVVQLPQMNLNEGRQEIEVKESSVDGVMPEPPHSMATANIDVLHSPTSIPVNYEGSEFPQFPWTLDRSGNFFSWSLNPEDNNIASLNTILLFTTMGLQEDLLSPVMDFTNAGDTIQLGMDLAFNYHEYSIQNPDTSFSISDTLEVSVSTDCGSTFETLFKQGGKELATFDEPFSPQSLQQLLGYRPESNNWEEVVVDLSDYAGEESVMVRIRYISGQGGNIFLNRVRVSPSYLMSAENEALPENISIYPNPAKERLNIDAPSELVNRVLIYDNTGKLVIEENISSNDPDSSSEVDIRHLKKGMYHITIETDRKVYRRKLLKK